jgi:hypothetical protein
MFFSFRKIFKFARSCAHGIVDRMRATEVDVDAPTEFHRGLTATPELLSPRTDFLFQLTLRFISIYKLPNHRSRNLSRSPQDRRHHCVPAARDSAVLLSGISRPLVLGTEEHERAKRLSRPAAECAMMLQVSILRQARLWKCLVKRSIARIESRGCVAPGR